ncbi:MAG: amidohydrolase family protein [Deltaproteobacteria bacterium]|nr:amidohydrolase family protein [Deltaproteobacteria bacterium]
MRWLVLLAGCGVSASAPGDAPAPLVPPPLTGGGVAFMDVAVATMDSPTLAQHQTVLVRGDTIVAVGSDVAVPVDATKIDGKGKFLIPGLHDMHVHLDGTRGMLALFVAHGVTTVRNMAGSPRTIALREHVLKGDLLGPKIVTAGPFVDGPRPRWESSDIVATPADAARVVGEQAAAGYDFVKVYNGLTVETYDAVLAAAKQHDLRVVGHVPFAVPLAHALQSGQASIEHLTGYAEAIERDDSPVRHAKRSATTLIQRWLYMDPAKLADVAALTARSGTWNVPTLVTADVYDELWRGQTPTAEDLDAVSPDWRARWDPKHSPKHLTAAVKAVATKAGDKSLLAELTVVRELVAAGAPLLAGTDTPNPYVVPGASLHQELALFVTAGLTPYHALRAATVDAAAFLRDPKDGRIAAGMRADLVLLAADPFADIHALDHIDGVMVRGSWLGPDRLKALHAELVERYRDPTWEHPIELGEPHTVQYVVSDNGAPVGAYAIARIPGGFIEKQTLEDETITARVHGHHLELDVERPDGVTHVDYPAALDYLTPASAFALVDDSPLAITDKTTVGVAQPDIDAPNVLRKGALQIERLPGATDAQRVYRLRLSIDRVATAARITLDGPGLPSSFKISSTTRPIIRSYTRRR